MKYSIIFAAAAVASEVYPTTIKDYDHKDCTVTAADQSVLVYHTQYTITHTESSKYGGYAQPTGAYPAAPSGCWYEKYERQEYAPFDKLGPHAIPGYQGVDDCEEAKTQQVVYGKEYKNGKWNSYTSTHTYGAPQAQITTYSKAGVYTYPSAEVTCDSTSYYAAEATKKYEAGEVCTYGGKYVKAEQTGYLTVPYGEYENGKPVLKTKTVYASTTGKVEVCKPTITSYPSATEIHYATAKWHEPGVYRYPAQVITADKDNYAYTCTAEQVKDYVYVTKTDYPAYPTNKPTKPEEYKPNYPSQPENNHAYATGYATGYAPYNGQAKPYSTNYAYAAESTPCEEEEEAKATGYVAKPVKGESYSVTAAESTPCDEEEEAKETGYVAKPVQGQVYSAQPTAASGYATYPTGTHPSQAQETDCEDGPDADKSYDGKYPTGTTTDAQQKYNAQPVDDSHKQPYAAQPASDKYNTNPSTPTSAQSNYPTGYPTDPQSSYPTGYPTDPQSKYPSTPSSDKKTTYPAGTPQKSTDDEDCDDEDKTDVNNKTAPYATHARRFVL